MHTVRIELLQQMPIFGAISEQALGFLLEPAAEVRVAAGSFFFREGEPAQSMYVLETGRVAILKSWDCTAIELTAAHLMRLYEHDLEQFALIQMNLAREMSRRLRVTDDLLFRARMGEPPATPSAVFRST
jgi:CRP/FNR family cyclic AMP-dependent transcriptional regulator